MRVWAALDVYGLTATGDGGASASGVTLPEALWLCNRAGGRDGTMVARCGRGSHSSSVLKLHSAVLRRVVTWVGGKDADHLSGQNTAASTSTRK